MYRAFLTIFFVLCLGSTIFSQDLTEIHKKIRLAVEEHQYSNAIAELQNLQSSDAKAFAINNYDYLLARMAEAADDPATAMVNYQTVVARDSILKAYALFHLARLVRESGNLTLERIYLQQLLLMSPNSLVANAAHSLDDALRESDRCLMCPDEPCIAGCPVGINIPGFIQKISEKNFRGAYDILTDTNLLPSICGRVCPQENQCEGVCTVGDFLEAVAIGRLERFVGDTAIKEGWVNIPYIEPNCFKVGIVGSGPAGIDRKSVV